MYTPHDRNDTSHLSIGFGRIQLKLWRKSISQRIERKLREAMRFGPGTVLGWEKHHIALFNAIGRGELGRELACHLIYPHALVQIVLRR